MFRIHCKNAISEEGLQSLLPNFTLTERQEEADGILVRSADMHEEKLGEATLAVARAGAGVNNIPLERFAEEGVVVFNTPGANANSVKELVICGMLLAARNVIPAVHWVAAHKDAPDIAKEAEKGKKQFVGTEICGKKLGVIGLGAIGAEVANAAVALGMEVYGYDPYLSVNGAWRISKEARHATSLEELCRQCDYITIHVPLTDKNPGMIGDKEIAAMKEGVVFLNFSRDKLVDERAMEAALTNGKVRLYVTDFANPLSVKLENAIVTPHLGASTEEAEDHCAVMAVKELMDYLDNGNIRNSVNYPDCDMGVPASAQRIALLHRNVPNMIGQISAELAKRNINIDKMTNKSRGAYAYTLLDLESCLPAEDEAALKAIPGVIRFRAVTGG
jgi:D-isomer specific 2-hydroxyacid dehydrogenase family protein